MDDDPILMMVNSDKEALLRTIEEAKAKLAELDDFAAKYVALKAKLGHQPRVEMPPGRQLPIRSDSIKAVITAECKAILQDGKRRSTRELRDLLLAHGVALNAKDQELQVSAVLSKAKDTFEASRKFGWALRHPQQDEGSDAGASEPSDSQQVPSAVPEAPAGEATTPQV